MQVQKDIIIKLYNLEEKHFPKLKQMERIAAQLKTPNLQPLNIKLPSTSSSSIAHATTAYVMLLDTNCSAAPSCNLHYSI